MKRVWLKDIERDKKGGGLVLKGEAPVTGGLFFEDGGGGGGVVGSYVGESERSGGKYQLGGKSWVFFGDWKRGAGAGVILEPAIHNTPLMSDFRTRHCYATGWLHRPA